MKKIIIMGATSGIGLRAAVILAMSGWKVGVAGRKEEVMRRLRKRFPDNVEWERIDILEADAPKKLMRLIKKLGGMDIYFHVAGVGFVDKGLNLAEELATVSTNALGFTRMIATAYDYFRRIRRRGQIAAVTSVAGTKGTGPLAAYSASKRFGQTYLVALEQLARAEHVRVRFTDIRPGWVRTPLLAPDRNYPLTMTMAHAVPLILRAIMERRRVAVIDWRWNILVGLWRLIPNALWIRIPMKLSTHATARQTARHLVQEQTTF